MANHFWFPGRWVGGGSLVFGPLLLLLAVVLRLPFFFSSIPPAHIEAIKAHATFFPLELAAVEAHPDLMVASYGSFLAGNILMWPAVATLVRLIDATRPVWALWGGALTIFGLFARTFHAGVDHFAFQLIRVQNLELATRAVGDSYIAVSYGPFNLIGALGFAVFFGWPMLAIGAYRSGTLGLIRSVGVGLMAALMAGVLKGSTAVSVVATGGLCIALVPLGIQMLLGRAGPSLPDAATSGVTHPATA